MTIVPWNEAAIAANPQEPKATPVPISMVLPEPRARTPDPVPVAVIVMLPVREHCAPP